MGVFLDCCRAVGHFVHWLTGWLVHPKRGGCCEMESVSDVKEKIESAKINKGEKENAES